MLQTNINLLPQYKNNTIIRNMTKYDLIVTGGGTAGCAAAYIAGKSGLKTLIIEKSIHLGGTITSALVVPVMESGEHQINTDFYNDFVSKMHNAGAQVTYQNNSGWFNPEIAKIVLDKMMSDAGVEVFFDTHILSVECTNRTIKSVTIPKEIFSSCNSDTKCPKISIETKYLIDATGNCETAKLCGCDLFEEDEQPVSLRFMMGGIDLNRFSEWLLSIDKDRNVTTSEIIDGAVHLTTAYTWDKTKNWALSPLFEEAKRKKILEKHDANYFQIFTAAGMPDTVAFNCPRMIDYKDTLKVKNMSKALMAGRQSILRLANFCKIYFPGFENAYISNIADMPGVRVSRRLKGMYVTTVDDIKNGKKFEHPVVISNYPVDVHSRKKNSSTLDIMHDYQLPSESLMTKEYDNLFVIGRCLSADFKAQAALRVQASCFSMGEWIAKYIARQEH